MRKQNLKWILILMLPLIISLVTISVEGTPDVTMFVDPPVIADEALQAPSTFDVRINISTTLPVYSWQFNLSWDPSVLTVIGYEFGDFLNAGNATNTTQIATGDAIAGWVLFTESALGADFPGKTGSGWLSNLTFSVADYGYTDLNIDHYLTYVMIKNHFPPPPVYQEDPVKVNGYFSNLLIGDVGGDGPGTPPDGDCDMFDFSAFAQAYATSVGDPKYDIACDFDRNGDVDMFDFNIFAQNYGRSL